MKENIKAIIVISLIIIASVAFYLGWEDKKIYDFDVECDYSIYIQACFSEEESGYDMDGEYYSETNYWYETVSEHYYSYTFNGELLDSNAKTELCTWGYYFTERPQITERCDDMVNFDNYKDISSSTAKAIYNNEKYSISNEDYWQYLDKKNNQKNIILHTWYGINGFITLN